MSKKNIDNYFSDKPLLWKDVRNQIKNLDQELFNIIDDLDPDDTHHFYKARYGYGSEIVKHGILQIPYKSDSISLDKASNTLKNQIGYNSYSNPVVFMLENVCEIFFVLPDRVMPYNIVKAGDLFGLSIIMNLDNSFFPQVDLWGVTAGVRSIFLLPKISESEAHGRLRKKYGLALDAPKHLLDHWTVFRELANQKEEWNTTLLLWNKSWFEHFDDPAWMPFNYYLQRKVLKGTGYWRNEYLLRLLLSKIHHRFNVKPSAYIVDTVRYLIQIAMGAIPGYAPATNDNYAPISAIQNAFLETYGLKYSPIIMHPDYFSLKNNSSPVYASLQHNGAIELGLKGSAKKTTLSDLYDVCSLMQKYQIALKEQKLESSISAIKLFSDKVDFRYFHGHAEEYVNILSSKLLPEYDGRFINEFKKMPFNYKANFLNGLIQIYNSNVK